jgi:serine/threonine-protein kinase HipA
MNQTLKNNYQEISKKEIITKKLCDITIKDGKYFSGSPSTHRIKFDEDDKFLMLNEYFCTRLAQIANLQTIGCLLENFGGKKVLIMERFDREMKESDESFEILKKDTIDGYQLVNLAPNQEIESSAISFELLYDSGIYFCKTKAVAKLEILKWAIYNLIISNYEADATNISFFVTKKGIEIAPFCELKSYDIYDDIAKQFIFTYGDTIVSEELSTMSLVSFCMSIEIHPRLFNQEFTNMLKIIKKEIRNLHSELYANTTQKEQDFLKKLVLSIENNIAKYEDMMEDFSQIYSECKKLV